MKKFIFSIIATIAIAINAVATTPDSVRYHNQATDTATINDILNKSRKASLKTPAERVVFIAKQFIGTPYEAATLEGDTEQLTINLSQLDCTTFVENVIALAQTAAIDTATVQDFIDNLRDIRYRNGIVGGYTSRLHYASDWVADNVARGNFYEVTDKLPRATKQQKSINYMSMHRRSYPALVNNDTAYQEIKEIEKKCSLYSNYYIPTNVLSSTTAQKQLKEGDIVLITTSTKGLDVTHMGIIVTKNSRPYLLHASSKGKAVLIDTAPLYNYLAAQKAATGIRIIRL